MRKFDYMEEAPEILVEALTLFDEVRGDFFTAIRTQSGGVMPEMVVSLVAEYWSMDNLLDNKRVPCVKIETKVDFGGSESLPRDSVERILSMDYWGLASAMKGAWNSLVESIPMESRGNLLPFEDLRGEFPA